MAIELHHDFQGAGRYFVPRGTLGAVELKYMPGSEAQPLAIVPPVHRGDAIYGRNNIAVSKLLQGAGFSTAQMNYAGYDHFGLSDVPLQVDHATLGTNIEDIVSVMEVIEPDTNVIIVLSCLSMNTAFHAAAKLGCVSHVLGTLPFPDGHIALQKAVSSSPEYEAKILDNGYVFLDVDPRFKVSKPMFDEAMPSVFDVNDNEGNCKPDITMVRNRHDPVILKGLIDQWSASLRGREYQVNDVVVEEIVTLLLCRFLKR